MRARILGTGLMFGVAVAVFGSPAAWADNAVWADNTDNPDNVTTEMTPVSDLPVTGEPGDPTHDLPADYVIINPAAARPGDSVAAQAVCAETDRAALTSPVLQEATLAPDPGGHQPWALHASTTVNDDAEPGGYQVSAHCAGGTVEQAGTGHGVSLSLLALGLTVGATAGAGAIAWRTVRR